MLGTEPQSQLSVRDRSSLIEDVVQSVMLRPHAGPCAPPLPREDDALAEWLAVSTLCAGPDSRRRILADLLVAGVPVDALIDRVIPAAARILGKRWEDDTSTFADVTIASARLQGLLRDAEQLRHGEAEPAADAPRILVLVPKGCQHTLGALVLACQLRHAGCAVRMSLCEDQPAVGRALAETSIDLVMISAAASCTLETIARSIHYIKNALARPVPVIVGGPALFEHPDILVRVGADLATSDVREAISLCSALGARGL